MIILYVIIAILAIMGIYMVAVMAVQSYQHKEFDAARCYVNELLKDFLCGRSYFRLECSEFPQKLTNDIRSYLSGEDLIRWQKRFEMQSQRMEEYGITPYGLPYYQFKLLMPSDDSKQVYEEMIRILAQGVLVLANCTEQRIRVEWYSTTENDFQICRILYARTAHEQETFKKVIDYNDSTIIEVESNDITDSELNSELQEYGESKDE